MPQNDGDTLLNMSTQLQYNFQVLHYHLSCTFIWFHFLNQSKGAPSLIKPRESERDLGSIDPDEVQNPVGLLQELMQKNGLAIPEYTAGSETAPPFTHTVKLPASGQSCTGQGMGW